MGEEVPLFVYGTLKDPRRLRALVGRSFPAQPAALLGWRLVPPHRSASGYPEVEPCEGERVEGLLLRGLDPEVLRVLDAYEEGYVRRRVQVEAGGTCVEAEAYVPVRYARAG